MLVFSSCFAPWQYSRLLLSWHLGDQVELQIRPVDPDLVQLAFNRHAQLTEITDLLDQVSLATDQLIAGFLVGILRLVQAVADGVHAAKEGAQLVVDLAGTLG